MSIHKDRYLFEDDHLLAVSKRSRELTVKGKGRVGKLPLFDLLKQDHPDLQVLHRLDFETSGVVLFAKTKAAFDSVLNSKFKDWHKVYHTLVMGRVGRPKGTLRFPLPARGKGTVEAETRYTVLDKFANSTYLETEILTGRHHQIRRHFAKINHPLVLDEVYGHKQFNKVFRQEFRYRDFFLHAAELTLPHPITGEELTIKAPLPKAFEEVLSILRSL